MRFGLSDLEELPSLKEFEALAREALGSDEGVAPSGEELASDEWRVASAGTPGPDAGGESVASNGAGTDTHSHESASEAIAHVEENLAEAEAFREHEVLATAEGMPSGQLDEDPPPPVVKSTAAGE
jgi:hypothetical protein